LDDEQSDRDMAKEIVSMYKTIWVEVEQQFPTCTSEERLKICSFISPLMNNMFLMALDEDLMEKLDKASGKKNRRR
jgi:hypothetical protein